MADIQIETDVQKAKAEIDRMAQENAGGQNSLIQQSEQGDISQTRNQEPKSIRPINAKPKKKSFGKKFKEAMFGDEIGDGTIAEHIFFRIFIPSLKRVISDMANSAVNMALGLDPKTRVIRSGESHVANARVYGERSANRSGAYATRLPISEYEWDEDAAKDIYEHIADMMERYHNVSVADVYSIMGMGDKIRSSDRNWGWTTMNGVDIYPVDTSRSRWIIDMPRAREI